MRALVASLAVLLALPGAAGAATVSVEPYAEPPGTDPFESCSRYMMCPPDMLVFTAAAAESNQLTITEEAGVYPRDRFLVRDEASVVEAGPGCEQIDRETAACSAAATGPIRLRDADDRVIASRGRVSGGPGDDLLSVQFGNMDGDAGSDVLIGAQGDGGAGDDLLTVILGSGDTGDDVLRCFPLQSSCHLDGGRGDDLVTGGTSPDRLSGGFGADVLRGGDGRDRLHCGAGRRDHALVDRRDRVTRCERVTGRRP